MYIVGRLAYLDPVKGQGIAKEKLWLNLESNFTKRETHKKIKKLKIFNNTKM